MDQQRIEFPKRHVVSDHTILAIVQGMRAHRIINRGKAEARDMATALRLVNEYQASPQMPRAQVEFHHREVTAIPREYSNEETIWACMAYLRQCTGRGDTVADTTHRPLDDFEITCIAAVEMLQQRATEWGLSQGMLRDTNTRPQGRPCYQFRGASEGQWFDLMAYASEIERDPSSAALNASDAPQQPSQVA